MGGLPNLVTVSRNKRIIIRKKNYKIPSASDDAYAVPDYAYACAAVSISLVEECLYFAKLVSGGLGY